MQASDLKMNSIFAIDGQIFVALDVRHVQQPRLASFLSIKYKNIETGQTFEKRFNPGDKLDEANIERKEMQYIYKDENLHYFMDTETFEQMPIDEKVLGDNLNYIKESGIVTINFALGRIISVTPPLFVELQVVETEPALVGDTVKASMKPATLETGYVLRVPLFISQGEYIKVDTRDGSYSERVK